MEDAHTFAVRLAALLAREHAALGEFLVALAEFDRQRLWVSLGRPSLFDFLTDDLGLSSASASFRKKAAELVQRFPEIAEPLRDGRLCLSSVYELAKVLTPENRAEVIPRFFRLSKRDAKAVVAAIRPADAPPIRDMITAVRLPAAVALAFAEGVARAVSRPEVAEGAGPDAAPGAVCPDKLTTVGGGTAPGAGALPAGTPGPAPLAAAAPVGSTEPLSTSAPLLPVRRDGTIPAALLPAPLTVEPLTAELNRLHLTVSRRLLDKLDAARAALSHSHPGASTSEILEAGLDLLIERHANRRGLVKNPRRRPRPSSRAGRVPAHVKREVWKRDGGSCQWPTASGGICGSKVRVELDHVVAKALGGRATVEHLRCLCRFHNDLHARQTFGDAWMDRYTRNPRAAPPAAAAAAPQAAATLPTLARAPPEPGDAAASRGAMRGLEPRPATTPAAARGT